MDMEITLPEEIPVMTLPNVAFFPQALMPLFIFEPRYRHMLREVLATNRLFAVAGIDARPSGVLGQIDPPHRVATLGIVRACQKTDNGTSNLLLQGLCRIEITGIVTEEPYRRIRVRALTSEPGTKDDYVALRRELARLLVLKHKLSATGSSAPGQLAAFLKNVDDPEAFVDIAAFSLCEDPNLKQRLLETLDVRRRFLIFSAQVREEIASLKLRQKLQGRLSEDQISDN